TSHPAARGAPPPRGQAWRQDQRLAARGRTGRVGRRCDPRRHKKSARCVAPSGAAAGVARRNAKGDRSRRRPVRIAVDTNVLVRYLTWDDEGQAIEAARAIEAADAIVVPTIVLCELVWVLKRAYRYGGPEIIDILRRLAAMRAIEIERPAAEAGIAML